MSLFLLPLLLLQDGTTSFTASGVALAAFCLAFITSVCAIAVMWGTFRADIRATRDWIREHESEAQARDKVLLEHTKLLTKLDAQLTERDKFYVLFLDRIRKGEL